MRALLLCVVLLAAACDREERDYTPAPPGPGPGAWIDRRSLHAGEAPFTTDPRRPGGYSESAWAIAEGKKLFGAMNCTGCHANGGGGMGPALMDDKWVYGHRPEDIFTTIVEGRPNGMPTWRGKLTHEEVWRLVAYVRSMSPLTARDRPSARDEHMHSVPAAPVQHPPTPRPDRGALP